MLRIFPTVSVFGNLDLQTGKQEREMIFYPTGVARQDNGILGFSNGIVFDTKKGEITLGQAKRLVKHFIIAQANSDGTTALQTQFYHADGDFAVVYMKSYGQFVVMDKTQKKVH